MKKTKIIALIVAIIALFAMLSVSVSAEAAATGWVLDEEGRWSYYYAEGQKYTSENGLQYIDGAVYYFNWEGYMYDDQIFGMYDGETDTYEYYRALPGGPVAMGWYFDEYEWSNDGDWYYYGADGVAASGLVTIDGTEYCFYEYGLMKTNTIHSEQGRHFQLDKDGAITELWDGYWTEVDHEWYYVQDGAICQGDFYLIDGAWYYFNWNGAMKADTAFEAPDRDENGDIIDWSYYRALENGKLAMGWHQDRNLDWYYYGADNRAVEGYAYVGDLPYYFADDGYMLTDRIIETAEGKFLVVSKEGICHEVLNNTWAQVGEDWYYVQDNMFCNGICGIDGALYHFEGGKLVTGYPHTYGGYFVNAAGYVVTTPGWYGCSYEEDYNANYYVFVEADGLVAYGWLGHEDGTWNYVTPAMRYNTLTIMTEENWMGELEYQLYSFDTAGAATRMYADGWYNLNYGWVYLRNGVLVRDEWMSTEKGWYYFDYNGYLVSNTIRWIEDESYYFDKNGYMAVNGWYEYGNTWVYADNTGALTTETVDASGYVFDYSGRVVKDRLYNIDGTWYVVGEEGIYIAILGEGWNDVNGEWYFVREGGLLRGEHAIDGCYYYFSDGKMMTDYRTYVDAMDNWGETYYGLNGVKLTGWICLEDEWYYADENGRFDNGRCWIDGAEYLFSGYVLQENVTTMYGGELITTDANGIIINENDDLEGWIYNVSNSGYGSVYYRPNGDYAYGWYGNYYIDGTLAVDRVLSFGDNYEDYTYYYVDKDGVCVYNSWINLYEDEYTGEISYAYAKADGTLAREEWLQIDGVWYYFNGIYMAADGDYYIEGAYHKFAENGAWLYQIAAAADGWALEDGAWYFYMAGKRVMGTRYIDGAWYAFDEDGMIADDIYDSYYYGEDGARANVVGWALVDGKWCYFTELNTVKFGWINDGGSYYYINEWYVEETEEWEIGAVTGYQIIDDILYYFDANGVWTATYESDGWVNGGEDWYYIKNGEAVRYEGKVEINGAYYAFDDEGKMVYNDTFNSKLYGADGAMITADGWHFVDGDWYYIVGGKLANGVHLIDGVQYYFEGYVMQ